MGSIEQALNLKEELDSLRPISKEQELKIMQKFRLDWNYHSNNLEGNSLTYGETKALILFGLTAQGKPLKDHIEIEGHNEAIEWIIDIVKGEYPLTESFVREIHSLLLKQSYTVDAITAEGLPTTKRVEIGKYKSQPNHVLTKTGEIFRFATPEETPILMGELIDWYRDKSNNANVNPILLAAEFHYKFMRIHPFDDGNGRTARILMNFILMKYNFPPVIIKTEKKNQYFSALQLADSGIIEAFISYIADNLVPSLEIMIRGAKGESIEEPDHLDKELALLELRLNGGIQVRKSKELLHSLYDNSLVPLFIKFENGCRKFDRFYKSIELLTKVDSEVFNNLNYANKIKENISENTDVFAIQYYYTSFINVKYGHFDFSSFMEIKAQSNTYLITAFNSKQVLEKGYYDHLTDKEINEMVNVELKFHRDFIEEKIKENFK